MNVVAIMKLTDVGSSPAEVERYLTDPEYLLQQKYDGTRIQARWEPGSATISFSNDGVKPVTHSAAKLKLPALSEELLRIFLWIGHDGPVTLEGELLIRTGEFVVWDLLVGDDPEQWASTANRTMMVSTALALAVSESRLVKATLTAWSEDDKRELWARINATGVEGAVSKHIDSRYEPGVRSKAWVKHKLCVRADLVVLTAQREFKPDSQVVKKGSATLGAYENGELKPICGASLIGRDLTIAPGDVVEVEYLYREPGGSLVQPRIVTKRWDKEPADCGFEQFAPYSREIVR